MALEAETYEGIKALEERRKDLNAAILEKSEAIAKMTQERDDAVRDFNAATSDLSAALDRAGVQKKADAYLIFDDASKVVLYRSHVEADALKADGIDPNVIQPGE